MWRITVLFLSILIMFTCTLVFARRQQPTDNTIILLGNDSLYRITVQGTAIRILAGTDIDDYTVSPSGDTIGYIQHAGSVFIVKLINPDGTNDRKLVEERRPRWLTFSPDEAQIAYLAYDQGELRLLLYDLQTQQRKIISEQQLALYPPIWRQNKLAYQTLLDSPSIGILVTDTATKTITHAATIQTNPTVPLAFSPDDKWLIFAAVRAVGRIEDGNGTFMNNNSLHVIFNDGRALRLITVGLEVMGKVVWTSDWILFSARLAGDATPATAIYKVKPDGSQLTQLTDPLLNASITDVSDDGKWILAESSPLPRLDKDVRILRIDIDGRIKEKLETPFGTVRNAQWLRITDLDWSPALLILAGVMSGVAYAAYRRFI